MPYCNMYCMCLIVTCTACASLKHTTWMLPRCTILYVHSTSFLSYFVYLTSLMYCIKFVSFLCYLLYWSNVISFFFLWERDRDRERHRETQREYLITDTNFIVHNNDAALYEKCFIKPTCVILCILYTFKLRVKQFNNIESVSVRI